MNVPTLKNEARLSTAPDAPSVKYNRHLPAIIIGYLTMAAVGVLLVMLVYGAVANFTGALPQSGVPIPFDRNDGLETAKVLMLTDSARSIHGDGATACAWQIQGRQNDLRRAVEKEIRNGLVWHPVGAQDRAALEVVTRRREYEKVEQ